MCSLLKTIKHPPLTLIVAVSENQVIGKDNDLIWDLSIDLQRFKSLTSGHHMIMGRKTFESIGRALDKRVNIVVSRNANWHELNTHLASDFTHALALSDTLQPKQTPIIIGGAMLYQEAIRHPGIRYMYLTVVNDDSVGDVLFPYTLDELQKKGWSIEQKTPGEACVFYALLAPGISNAAS